MRERGKRPRDSDCKRKGKKGRDGIHRKRKKMQERIRRAEGERARRGKKGRRRGGDTKKRKVFLKPERNLATELASQRKKKNATLQFGMLVFK